MLTSIETTTEIITSTTTNGPIKISALEGKALLDANPNIILVDVRTIEEYLEVRIPGAISAPLADLVLVAEYLLPDKNAIYIIYCRTGNKSAEAVRMLFELGYTTLYDMGGIYFWPYEKIS
jgi:phage shock protein E